MTDRQTFTHKYIPKSMDLFEQEKEAHEKALKLKKEFSETENASIRDFHWYTKFCYDGSERGNVRIVISYRKKLEYETKNVEQLRRELKEAKEKLEELEEEFEEIEDLEEDELGDFDFESKEEYEERLDELDDDIDILESEIEVIEEYLKEKKDQ